MESSLLSALLPLALRSLSGTHDAVKLLQTWFLLTVSFPHSQHIFSPHFTWPHSSFWDHSSLFLQLYFLITSVPTLWSSSLGCLHCLLCRAGKCWFEDRSKLSSFLYVFLGHFMQIHSFNVASKCESVVQTSTLSTHDPFLSLHDQIDDHTQTHTKCCVPYFDKWYHHWVA